MMTDSFPVRVPRLGTQHIRQKYYCHYHRMQCVKLFIVITHEDIVLFVSGEAPGSTNDKQFLHRGLHSFPFLSGLKVDRPPKKVGKKKSLAKRARIPQAKESVVRAQRTLAAWTAPQTEPTKGRR